MVFLKATGASMLRYASLRTFSSSSPALSVRRQRKKTKREAADTPRDHILHLEIQEALKAFNNKSGKSINIEQIENPTEVIQEYFAYDRPQTLKEVPIIYQTSEGDGLGVYEEPENNRYGMVRIPKTIPGDIVNTQMLRHHKSYAEGSVVDIKTPSTRRRDKLVVCEKFDTCSGCQFQMTSYDDQLEHKRDIISRAYKFFYPKLDQPEGFGYVNGSTMQYAYRTKLTPHYKVSKTRHVINGEPVEIGFNSAQMGKGRLVDVEHCPISSPAVNQGLRQVHTETHSKISKHIEETGKSLKDGTLLLRESFRVDHATGEYDSVCLSNPSQIVTEKVGDYVFQFPATEFFQINRYILPDVLDYIKYHLSMHNPTNLVDAYCGSGFFGISLSSEIPGKVFGIEVAANSLKYATHNAKLNGLSTPEKVSFIEGNADDMFKNSEFIESKIDGKESVVIMDPSRKGSSESFMGQLLEFQPKLIVYVSCNVFTQARDLATFERLQQSGNTAKYRVKEVTGFDFFPQTKHVESVAILERI
ncbi:tRNA (uracil(54)-C(5))-methyltransferase [[Candida] anglica]